MNLITPLVLLIVSGALFFGWINPLYQGEHLDANGKNDNIITLKAISDSYDAATANQIKLKNKIISLTQSKSDIPQEDITRLDKMLPNNVDNVRLIVEIEDIAKRYSQLGFKGVSVNKTPTAAKTNQNSIVTSTDEYSTLNINFTVTMAYNDFVNFLRDLEDNLRLVDINNVSFSANDLGTYDFTVSLNTYWLNTSN